VLSKQQVAEVWDEPPELFIQRLTIANLSNKFQTMSPLLYEQEEYLQRMVDYRQVLALKPRAVGFTTVSTLFLFAKTYRSPDPRVVLQSTVDDNSLARIRNMVDVAYDHLPSQIQFGKRVNDERTLFLHNQAQIRRVLGGARGAGRGATYSDWHATESAFYPQGSSSSKQADTAKDDDLFVSIKAAMHDPEGHILNESTGNGPGGAFHRSFEKQVRGEGSPDVGLVFLPWSKVARYRRKPPPGFEPTPDEQALMAAHGLDLEQICWRRHQMQTTNSSLIRFQREYPLTWMDPFRLDEANWFDQDALVLASSVASLKSVSKTGLVTFLQPERNRSYYLSVDTSGGVGRDELVVQGLRDDLEHAFVFADNKYEPDDAPALVADLARTYNNALVLVEANHYGRKLIEKLENMPGIRLWKKDKKDWTASGQQGGDSKREMMTHARKVLREGMALPRDPKTIMQLQLIVEDHKKRIAGRGGTHDDRAIAWCLALWCAREHTGTHRQPVDLAEERHRLEVEAAKQFEANWRPHAR
jgi:hypothetical protein